MSISEQKETKVETSFLDYEATKQLMEFARNPFDLTMKGNLNPQRIDRYRTCGCGLKLLFATERMDDAVLEALYKLAEESNVYEKMEQMQNGAVINRIIGYESENRSVLHTAMRDLFDNPNTNPKAKEAAGLAKKEHDKLQAFLKRTEGKFTDIVTVGIGGSDLGPESIYFALEHLKKEDRNAHFISNVDPDNGSKVLKNLNLEKTLVVVISKSGTTLETVTNEALAKEYFFKAGVNPDGHFIAVTGEGSPMDDRSKYLECFYMWDFIGGRYCATAMPGGLLLSFTIGYDNYLELLRGAHAMDQNALNKDPKKNLPLQLALNGIWNHNFLDYATNAIIPYSQALGRFPAHIQQADMESNGKHIDKLGNRVKFKTGPIIWGEPGTNAQHSFFQLIHQGTEIVHLEFIGFKHSQYGEDVKIEGTTSQEKLLSNLFAQAIALATGKKSDNPNQEFLGNRPSTIILADKLTPYTMGALFALYEHKVDFQGFIWGINSFDQEGVQLGKVLAGEMMKQFKGDNPNNYPLGAAYLKQLNEE
ncbi:glucose-6-phosphate isomerase [Chlamydiales bacterium]|nr:glucose-6-phosphate isomerase [Chlamydiales bacterium]